MTKHSALKEISLCEDELAQGQAADLSDKIRTALARIGRGEASPDDNASIASLIDKRIAISLEQGLRAAHTAARKFTEATDRELRKEA